MMGKRKTAIIVMLSVVLAALVAAAAVLGTGLARYATVVDTDEAVGEARWRVSVGAVEEEVSVNLSGVRPDENAYSGSKRERTCLVCVALLGNHGDVDASVTVTADGGGMAPVTDGADGYTDGEILSHFSVGGMYYSSSPYTESSRNVSAFPDEGAVIKSGDAVYIYLEITWTTDLDRDINDTGSAAYDGRQGDEFDIWASKHLLNITVPVTVKSEQTETV